MREPRGPRYSRVMRTHRHGSCSNASRARVALASIALVLMVEGCHSRPVEQATNAAVPDTLALEPITAEQLLARAREPGARATLVNIWATWCGPCREEFPALVSMAKRHRTEGLRVLFVSADFEDQAPAARAFLAEHDAPGPWLLKSGPDMEFINGLDRRWTGALPLTLVYDSRGTPVEFWEGGADSSRFEAAVAPLLATTAP